MRRRLAGAWALALSLAAGLAMAADVQVGAADRYPLSSAFSYLEDPTGQLTLDDVMAPDRQQGFRPAPTQVAGQGPNFGLSTSAYWLRIVLEVDPGAPREWLLDVAYPPLDRVEVYSPDPAFGYEHQVGGDHLPFAQRPFAHRHHVFPLALPTGTHTLYLRVQSEGTVSAPATLWRPAALSADDHASYAGLSLYFGLLLGLLVYNLLLYVSVRESGYLSYVAFVAAMGIAQAALSGLGAQFLWPQWPWWTSVSVPVALSATAVFGLLFARSFLSSAARMPVLDRVLLVQLGCWLLAAMAGLALPYTVAAHMVMLLAPVTVLSIVAASVVSIRRGFAGARHFFAAWAVLLAGVLTLLLHDVGVLPSHPLTVHSLLIGSALEMVLLSFALGHRINVARRFKEQAQARIAAEHAMVQALSHSQERLKELLDDREVILENSIVGIAFLSPQGRLKWANKAMLDMFGAGRNVVTSMEPFYLSREQYLQVGADVAHAVARGEVYERELPVRKWDGTRLWIQLSGKAVSRSDLSQGTVWVIMDISERKQLEEQLRHSMSEREAILNNAVVGIVLSVQRRHEWVNEKFAQMLGHPRQVLIGQSSSYIHPDEESWQRFGEEARAALVAANRYTCERQLRRRTGELFWVEMGGSCIRPHDPDAGVIWTFLDITARKTSEAQIRQALDKQQVLNEQRARFVAVASREFRTPLATIRSAEEILRQQRERLAHAECVQALDDIAAGVHRMSRMIDRVLLLGQAEAKALAFAPRPTDVAALCRQLADEAVALHPGSACQVVAQCAPDVGPGPFDEQLLRHILGNLLSNAIQYSPRGGQVRLDVRRERDEMVFEVSDQGIGIPADEVPHLFGSFHRASNVGAIPGTGLGLAIARNAAQVHGGRIEVESQLGVGTRFTVRVPANPDPVLPGAPARAGVF